MRRPKEALSACAIQGHSLPNPETCVAGYAKCARCGDAFWTVGEAMGVPMTCRAILPTGKLVWVNAKTPWLRRHHEIENAFTDGVNAALAEGDHQNAYARGRREALRGA